MSKHTPAIGDMEAITNIHSNFIDRVNDMAMAMQDASYQVGRQRGLSDGKAQRDDLLEILERAVRRLEIAHENGDTIMREWIVDARAAIAKATWENK